MADGLSQMASKQIERPILHEPHPECPYLDRNGVAVPCPYRTPDSLQRARIEMVDGVFYWIVWEV